MTIIEILTKFAEYSDYDPNRRSFNLLSNTYNLHRCCETISQIREYDPTGVLGMMYAKDTFFDLLNDSRIKLLDLFRNPDCAAAEREMWDIFHSEEVRQAERSYINAIEKLVEQVCGRKLIGEMDEAKTTDQFLIYVNRAIDGLRKCQTNLFLKGGTIHPVKHISTHIHVFNTLRDCLLSIEQAQDGLYLCWIDNNHTADGYFGFFLKSNGNIVSVNERVDEPYPGAHKNSRNGRWAEDKADCLFPYNFIFEFGKYDYKGYASQYLIDDEKLAFFNLDEKVYVPLVLAMVMLNNRFTDTEPNMPLMYVDSLLKINALEGHKNEQMALAVINGSLVARSNMALTIDMTTEGVLNAAYAKECNDKTKSYKERGSFTDDENIFIKLYGKGFKLKANELLVSDPHLKQLGTGEQYSADNDQPNPEFIGTETRMMMAAYYQARIQLAEYLRDKIHDEYQAFGGRDGVKKWYDDLVKEHIDTIYRRCVERAEAGDEPDGILKRLYFANDVKVPDFSPSTKLNENEYKPNKWGGLKPTSHRLDRDNGAVCSMFFTFKPRTWKDIEEFFGIEVPKIVKGWVGEGHRCRGNSILDACDKVEEVGTPFEYGSHWHDKRYSPYEKLYFEFQIGFSKRGLKAAVKKFKEENNNGD